MWIYGVFNISLFKSPIHILPNEKLASNKVSSVQFGNTVGIRNFFEETICKRYDKMYSQRAFVDWYIYEGM